VYQNENEISVMLNYKSPVVQINLLNVSGQEIEQQLQGVIITNNSYTFAKSNLATGVYFIQVISKNQVLSKKIVVQ
jgi:hypothetical protein